MSLNNMGLGFVFTAQNLAGGTINRLRGQLRGLGSETQGAAIAMRAGFGIAAAGIVPLVAGIGTLSGALNLAGAAAEFEQGIARVANISGSGAEELRELRNAAIQAGIETSFSPTEAVEGLTALASKGFTAAESMRLLDQSLALAEGGQIGVADAAAATSAAIRVFGENVGNTEEVADRLLAITSRTSLQAEDLTLALGTVSRGAGLTSQSLDEMLISMGLVRNAGVDVSTAASSVSSALQFMGKNAQAFKSRLDVAVTDASGAFRPFIDVVLEADAALSERFTNAAERATAATELFGRFGVTAFQNVSAQIRNGVRDSEGNLLRGAAAVDFLRESMENAGGTAEAFRDRLLDTFAGQQTLLQGTLQTFGVVLGEPFARLFKPLVKIIVDSLNFVLQAFNNLPDGLKDVVAAVIVAAGAFSTIVGVVSIFSGLLIVILPFLKLIGVALGAGLLALLPFIAAVGTAIAAVVAFRALLDRNIGGIGDFVTRQFEVVRLAFQAVTQLFSDGGFSGEVREEMSRAGNQGIRQFAIDLFRIGSRIIEFSRGFARGFGAGIERLAPTMTRFMDAIREIGELFGFVETGIEGVASAPMGDFEESGIELGEVFSNVLGFIIETITFVMGIVTSFGKGFKRVLSDLGPLFGVLMESFSLLGDAVAEFFGDTNEDLEQSQGGFNVFSQALGQNFGFVATAVVGAMILIVRAITWAMNAFEFLKQAGRGVGTFFQVLGIQISGVFSGIVDAISNAIDFLITRLGRVVSRIPAAFRPDFADDLIEAGQEAQIRTVERTVNGERRAVDQQESIDALQGAEQQARNTRATAQGDQVANLANLMREERDARSRAGGAQPLSINLLIDGEVAGTAVANAERSGEALAFTPGVPSEV